MSCDHRGELLDKLAQLGVLPLRAPQSHECAHDEDVHGDRPWATQDARQQVIKLVFEAE